LEFSMTFRPNLPSASLMAALVCSCTSVEPIEPPPDVQQVAILDDLAVQRQDVAMNPENLRLRLELAQTLQDLERPLEAAEQFELCAQLAPPAQQRNCWQRASKQRELGGDLPQALADLQKALQGMPLKDSEKRLLERLQAFQYGDFEHPADAIEVLRHHGTADFRYQAAQFLAQQDFAADAAVFADSLADSDPRIAVLAARELALRGSEMDVPAIVLALGYANSEVQYAATRCLGLLGTAEVAPELIQRLNPADRSLFRLQRQALTRLTEHFESDELDPDLPQRKIIAQAWTQWWQRSH
jgi:tetratricopeptide (TPR) repeat protein